MHLKFPPHMTLQAAARIAHAHGCALVVTWGGTQAQVTLISIEASATILNGLSQLPEYLRKQEPESSHG